jgi:hypothetical protein
MRHAILITLNILMIVEPVFSGCALMFCIRMGGRNPVSSMRSYLILRTANAAAVAIILLWPGQFLLMAVRPSLLGLIYYYWFWIVALLMLLLEMRVAVSAVAVFFADLVGLQGLLRLASRWIAIAGVIVVVPLLLSIAANFNTRAYLHLFRWWWNAYSVLEMVPVFFALSVGLVRKVRWNSRTVTVLVGFMFEPLVHLIRPWSWTSKSSMLQLENVAHEIACCAAVALWTFCFAVPSEAESLAPPTPAMLRLEALVRGPLRKRHPVITDEAYTPKGAQPWPKYRRDA